MMDEFFKQSRFLPKTCNKMHTQPTTKSQTVSLIEISINIQDTSLFNDTFLHEMEIQTMTDIFF